MKWKRWLGKLHLWVGLAIGLLFFVIALSGAIYTWEPEFSQIAYKKGVENVHQPYVSPSTLKQTLEQAFPEGDYRTVFWRDSSHAAEVLLYAPGTYYNAFLDPYTGALIHLQDMNKGWINYVKFIHRNLMLGQVGRKIVHWVTLLSLLMLITGIVLWWPVNRRVRRDRFRITWGAHPFKLNYDLHNVLGFYASAIILLSVLTGLFWGFAFVREGLRAGLGENGITYETPQSVKPEGLKASDPFPLMDSLAVVFRARFPDKALRISNPHAEDEPIRVVLIDPGRMVYSTEHYYFDRYTGKRIEGHFENGLLEEASAFHIAHGLVYDIHLGNVFGLPFRIILFLASLIAASLPVTGFIIWWKRR